MSEKQQNETISDPSSRSYESLQYNLNSIQQQLADFVSNEEDAVESRIRWVFLVIKLKPNGKNLMLSQTNNRL